MYGIFHSNFLIQWVYLSPVIHLQLSNVNFSSNIHACWHGGMHDDVIKWKHFLHYWPFVWGIHRSMVNSPHKGQWRGALVFSYICFWINSWVNNREAGDLRRYHAHYDVIVMWKMALNWFTVVIAVLCMKPCDIGPCDKGLYCTNAGLIIGFCPSNEAALLCNTLQRALLFRAICAS